MRVIGCEKRRAAGGSRLLAFAPADAVRRHNLLQRRLVSVPEGVDDHLHDRPRVSVEAARAVVRRAAEEAADWAGGEAAGGGRARRVRAQAEAGGAPGSEARASGGTRAGAGGGAEAWDGGVRRAQRDGERGGDRGHGLGARSREAEASTRWSTRPCPPG